MRKSVYCASMSSRIYSADLVDYAFKSLKNGNATSDDIPGISLGKYVSFGCL